MITQILFTVGFVLLLLAVIAVLAIQLCFVIEKEIYAMKVLAIDMSVAGQSAFTAVLRKIRKKRYLAVVRLIHQVRTWN